MVDEPRFAHDGNPVLRERREHVRVRRAVLVRGRRQQLDERLATLQWPFQQERSAPDSTSIHSLLADLDMGASQGNAARLPRMDWRACMRPGSTTSVWWISALACALTMLASAAAAASGASASARRRA